MGTLPGHRITVETNSTRDILGDAAVVTKINTKINITQKPKQGRRVKHRKTGRVTLLTVIMKGVDVLSQSLAQTVQGQFQIAPCRLAAPQGIHIIVIAQANGEGLGLDRVL
jgi:hypothetical protein